MREQSIVQHHYSRKNGGRHEVNFGDARIRIEIHSSDETSVVSIVTDHEFTRESRRRFALIIISRHQFSEASGLAAPQKTKRHELLPEY
jgi:hypothetical protein